MKLNLCIVKYDELNARQQESYNYHKVSAILADYGFTTIRLSDDWQNADFIAQHIDGEQFIKIQQKGRVTFSKKYLGKDLWIAFSSEGQWYLYPHDHVLGQIEHKIKGTSSWDEHGAYSWPGITQDLKFHLEAYKI